MRPAAAPGAAAGAAAVGGGSKFCRRKAVTWDVFIVLKGAAVDAQPVDRSPTKETVAKAVVMRESMGEGYHKVGRAPESADPVYGSSRLGHVLVMSDLPAELSALLSPAERIAYAIAARANRGKLTKRVATAYLRGFSRPLVSACSSNLLHTMGVENLTALAPDRGVLVASNHRSFFDLYVISDQMLRSCPWVDSMYFPVRSEYFYTHASGTLVNASMSALAMYPPIFRDPTKRPLNEHAVQILKQRCASAGAVIGIHPEGTRGTGDDPYTLLPPKAGTGEIIFHARPIVLPVFLLGISNSMLGQFKGNVSRTGDPITVCYGKPLDLSAYFDRPATHETYLQISAAVCDAISDLGRQERELRRERGLPPPRAYRSNKAPAGVSGKPTRSPDMPPPDRDAAAHASSAPPAPPA